MTANPGYNIDSLGLDTFTVPTPTTAQIPAVPPVPRAQAAAPHAPAVPSPAAPPTPAPAAAPHAPAVPAPSPVPRAQATAPTPPKNAWGIMREWITRFFKSILTIFTGTRDNTSSTPAQSFLQLFTNKATTSTPTSPQLKSIAKKVLNPNNPPVIHKPPQITNDKQRANAKPKPE